MDKQQIVFKHDQLDIDKSTCDDWVNNLITRYENNEINTFASFESFKAGEKIHRKTL